MLNHCAQTHEWVRLNVAACEMRGTGTVKSTVIVYINFIYLTIWFGNELK